MSDIIYKTDDYIFSYRVGGVLIHGGKVLLQKIPGDNGYALPGGHVSFGETTDTALIREFKEELHADIIIQRMLMYGENFLQWNGKPCQQICVYYLVSLIDVSQIPMDGCFHAFDECGGVRDDLNFCWVSLDTLENETVYPIESKPYILAQPNHIVSFIHKDR